MRCYNASMACRRHGVFVPIFNTNARSAVMIQHQFNPSGEGRWIHWPALTFATATALVGAIFGLAVPFVAYVSGAVQTAFRAQYPRIPLFIIHISPWAPLLFAFFGIAVLVAKERFARPTVSLRANIATIFIVAALGAFTCFIVALPAMQIMQKISN